MDYVNEFVINGKVVAIKEGRHPSVRLITKSGKKESFPLVSCTKEMLSSLNLHVQSRIQVKGTVESIFVKTKDNGYQRRQIFKALEITPASTLCEEKFGSSGRFFDEMSTNVYIKGTLVSQNIRDDGWASLIIQTSESDRDTVKVNLKTTPNTKKLHDGDTLCVIGTISTVNKTFNNENRHFENIVVSDLAIERKKPA